MEYMIVYCKTTPATTYRNTLTEAKALAVTLERYGYAVDIWEMSDAGAKQINR